MTTDRCLRRLDFDFLQQLVDNWLPATSCFALCDVFGELVWQFGGSLPMDELCRRALQSWRAMSEEDDLPPGRSFALNEFHAARILCRNGETAGLVLARFQHHADGELAARQLMETIAAGIGREFQLLCELEDMANDLTDRFEELNLVYAVDSDLRDAGGTYQALQQLLRRCVEHRRAELAVLLHPEILISLHEGQTPATGPSLETLIGILGDRVLPRFQGKAPPEGAHHPSGCNEVMSLPGCKMLTVPVYAGVRGVVGILALVNSESKPDFTNSNQHLLKAMSQRVEMIVAGGFDPLTGLMNRSSFERRLVDAESLLRETEGELFLLHLDIDYLQIVNDAISLQVGDQLIRDAGHLIRSSVGEKGWVAHFGGGKFNLALQQPSIQLARELAHTLCARFQEIRCQALKPSFSIGLTPYASSSSVEDALTVAEAACALAKKQGRNRVHVYQRTEKDFLDYKHDLTWFNRIHQALAEDRLELFGQAIRPVSSPSVCEHFEVLLRMRGERGEWIPPGVFLPAAERYNLMTMIDRRVVDKSFGLLHQHQPLVRQGRLRLSVNLSAQSINDPEFQVLLLGMLETYPHVAKALCFEVTETSALASLDDGDEFLSCLQAHGCQCSLDDFGTGVSSFAYLRHLRVDNVKIDGSFIKPLDEDVICQAIVRSIHEIARLKGISTVAEFVENGKTLRHLASIGIDYAQGYGIHKPEPLVPLIEQLSSSRSEDPPAAFAVVERG